MTDDPGVLGNLPRSRPGRRSDKRGDPESPKRQTTARKTTARRSTASRKPRGAGTARRPQARPAPQQSTSDPVSDAIRAAGGLAEAGVKTAVKVAGGVLKRIPRP